mmetsp:Transcript_51663/g.112265  ORF Transcript_51663/g.112265 Transcript_51663/m.112265 type:complete len:105 (-) Transcript_51663:165-479(-)
MREQRRDQGQARPERGQWTTTTCEESTRPDERRQIRESSNSIYRKLHGLQTGTCKEHVSCSNLYWLDVANANFGHMFWEISGGSNFHFLIDHGVIESLLVLELL